MKKNIVNIALFSLLIAACDGMDPGMPDPNTGDHPEEVSQSNGSNDSIAEEMSFLADCGSVEWLVEKEITCESAGDVVEGRRIVSVDVVDGTCQATWTYTQDFPVFLSGIPKDAAKIQQFRQENPYHYPTYADEANRMLTVFTGDDDAPDTLTTISCAIAL